MDSKKFIITFSAVCSIAFMCTVCAIDHRKPGGNVWADATLIAEQQAVIAEQRRTLDDLGATIGGIRLALESARADLDQAIRETSDLREQWAAIDDFVRSVINAERQLEELQHPDR